MAHRFVYFRFFACFCLQKRYFGENIHFQFRPTPYPLRNISEGSGNINNPSLILPLRKQKTHDGKHFPKQAYAVLHVRRHIVLKPIPTKDWGFLSSKHVSHPKELIDKIDGRTIIADPVLAFGSPLRSCFPTLETVHLPHPFDFLRYFTAEGFGRYDFYLRTA